MTSTLKYGPMGVVCLTTVYTRAITRGHHCSVPVFDEYLVHPHIPKARLGSVVPRG